MIALVGEPERCELMSEISGDVYQEDELKHYHRRRNSLTEDDIELIRTIVESITYMKQGNHVDPCRFGTIAPEDLRAMIDAHKKFNAAMDDSKVVVRRFILMAILTAMGGIAVIGWWETVVKHVKKAIIGN